jgi:aminopeptidase N
MVGRLIAVNDHEAPARLAAEIKRDNTDDGRKYAFAVQAGAPDATVKQRYFAMYQQQPTSAGAQQEDWLSTSLGSFNNVRQSALTLPYLQRSLDQLPEIKQDRKIFYLGAWLGAFLGGQTSPEAEAIVKQWLTKPGIDADLRRKVLENADPLERTVKIRARFPE